MKKIFLSLVLAGSLFAADVVMKTAGVDGLANGLSVQNSASTKILSVDANGTVTAAQGRISDKSGLLSPAASVTMFAGSVAPTGWLICNGNAVSRTTYADLFALVGETYGAGDTTTTFNLPNMLGKGVVGKSSETEFDVLGETGGAKTHTLTTAQMPSHNHSFARTSSDEGGNGTYSVMSDDQHQGTNQTLSMNNTGGNSPHNNLAPYIVMNYIIKY